MRVIFESSNTELSLEGFCTDRIIVTMKSSCRDEAESEVSEVSIEVGLSELTRAVDALREPQSDI